MFSEDLSKGRFIEIVSQNYNEKTGKKVKLDDALNNYASSRGLVLDSFSYLGGIKRTGIYAGESTPYFFGVRLNLDEKELEVGDYLVKEMKFNA